MSEVFAVKQKEDIALVSRLLEKHKGELYSDVWNVGINVALRISDLRAIKFCDCEADRLNVVEIKTGKKRSIWLNQKVRSIIDKRREQYRNDIYVFQAKSPNRKHLNTPITSQAVGAALREIGDIVGIKMSTHSMRKTWGYHTYTAGTPIEQICAMLNHSTPNTTLKYIGIQQEDFDETYASIVL